MSRILKASCSAQGKVTCEGVEIPEAIVLSEGKAQSDGLLFIQAEKVYYVPSSALDIKALIEALVGITDKIIAISTGLDAVTVSPGGQAANIAQLMILKVQLEQSGEALR